VARNRCRACAIKPEFFARFRAHRDKTLARARVRHAHDLRSRLRHRVFIVANDVTKQRHFWQFATAAFGFITDRTQIPLVQMLQTCQARAVGFLSLFEIIGDFDNARNRLACLSKKFQTHGAGEFGHTMKHPTRTGNQTIRTFFLHPWQT